MRPLQSRTTLALLASLIAATAVAGPAAAAEPAGQRASSDGSAGQSVAPDATTAKRCRRGRVRVRRPGRSSVCARKCERGFKHKVGRRGKVSCVRKQRRRGGGQPRTGAPGGGAPGGGAPPASGPAAGAYSGQTEQSRPVTFSVGGGQVTGFEAGVNTYCSTQGNQRVVFDAISGVGPMAIAGDGSFAFEGEMPGGETIRITGRISGGSASGTVGMTRGDSNYVFSEGRTYFGTCSAFDVPFTAAVG